MTWAEHSHYGTVPLNQGDYWLLDLMESDTRAALNYFVRSNYPDLDAFCNGNNDHDKVLGGLLVRLESQSANTRERHLQGLPTLS